MGRFATATARCGEPCEEIERERARRGAVLICRYETLVVDYSVYIYLYVCRCTMYSPMYRYKDEVYGSTSTMYKVQGTGYKVQGRCTSYRAISLLLPAGLNRGSVALPSPSPSPPGLG